LTKLILMTEDKRTTMQQDQSKGLTTT